MIGKTVCYHHGGKSKSGLQSGTLKTGRYSKVLPARLAERYHEAAADPNLLSQRDDIALLDTRLSDVLNSISAEESGLLWNSLHNALDVYDNARGKDADDTRSRAFQQMRTLIREGYEERQSWHEIRAILQERKALVDGERKRLIDMQQMLTVQQANVMLGAVTHAVMQAAAHITDKVQRKAVLDSMSRSLSEMVNVPER